MAANSWWHLGTPAAEPATSAVTDVRQGPKDDALCQEVPQSHWLWEQQGALESAER